MSDGLGGKLKEFFGFGEVENYQDPYFGDGFSEEGAGARRESVSRDAAERSAMDRGASTRAREDRYSSRTRSSYGEYGSGASRTPGASRFDEPAVGARSSAANPVEEEPKEPKVVRIALSTYTQGSDLAEIIKSGDVTVFNLGGMEKGEARRVLDFAAGLARGVDAELKKLNGVRNFVLIPQGLHLEPSQLEQLAEEL